LKRNGSWESRVTGFLFLPDVNLQDIVSDPASADGVRKNGFAALKELDYLMNMERSGNGDSFKQSYTENFEVNYTIPPYDICNLVSSIDKEGRQTTKRDFCMLSVAETIVNFIADERNPRASEGQDFSISSYWSNITGTESRARDRLGANKLPVVYKYCAVGASSGILPLGKVLDSITYKFLKKMTDIYDAKAGLEQVNELTATLGVSANGIITALRSNVEGLRMPSGDYDIIKSAPDKFVEVNLSDQLLSVKAKIEKNSEDYYKKIKEQLTRMLLEYFMDMTKGPFYVKRLLENTSHTSFSDYLSGTFGEKKGLAEQFVDMKQKREWYNTALAQITHSKERLSTKNLILGIGASSIVNSYKNACFNYYNSQYNDAVFDYAKELCLKIKDYVAKEYAEIYDVYADLLTTIRDIFVRNFNNIDNEQVDSEFYWDLFSSDEFVEKIDELIADGTIKIDLDEAVSEFLKTLIDERNRDVWLGKTKKGLRIAQSMNDFICSQFRVLSDASVGNYMNYMLTEGQFENKASEIQRKLADNSQVMFPFKANIPKSEAQVKYISAPINVIDNAALASTFPIGETGNEVTVKGSVLTTQFFQLTVNPGIPLTAYRELEFYEGVYERTVMSADSNGLHLYEGGLDGDRVNWKTFLPSPVVEQSWSNRYVNERTKIRNRDVSSVFEKAEKYGYIQIMNGKYTWREASKIDIESIISSNGIVLPKSLEEISNADATEIISMLQNALDDSSRYTSTKEFFDTMTINGQPDRRYAIGTLAATPIIMSRIKDAVYAHEDVTKYIARLSALITADSTFSDFSMAMASGIIRKERMFYKYNTSSHGQGTSATQFFRLDGTDDQFEFSEFYVFKAYLTLDANIKATIKTLANEYLDESDESEVINGLSLWQKTFGEKLSLIQANKKNILEASAKERFYSNVEESLIRILKQFS